jgi:AraC-like DNA-binding protein
LIDKDLEALWGRFTQDLREQLFAAANPAKRFRVLERALVTRLENTVEEHRAVRAALEIFGRDAGEAKIRDLAAHLGLSQRHFIRVFSDQVGVTPKQFGVIICALLTALSAVPPRTSQAESRTRRCGCADHHGK